MGRVAHLHVLDVASGRIVDLFEGTASSCRAWTRTPTTSTSRPTAATSPSSSIPRRRSASTTARRWPRSTSRSRPQLDGRDRPAWDFDAPRYSPDGARIAFLASQHGPPPHRARQRRGARARRRLAACSPAPGTTPSTRRCAGRPTARRSSSPPRSAAAATSGATRSRARTAAIAAEGGWVHWFDVAGDTVVTVADAMQPSGPACTPAAKAAGAARLERFNDELLAAPAPRREARSASSPARTASRCRCGSIYPPGFDAARRRSTRCCTASTAARTRPRATPSTTAGTTSSSRPRATSSPA